VTCSSMSGRETSAGSSPAVSSSKAVASSAE
jgi:hypothetical protein